MYSLIAYAEEQVWYSALWEAEGTQELEEALEDHAGVVSA